MNNARELLQDAKLAAAIDSVTQEVKARPSDVGARIFLFELLCFTGDLDRAEKQLDVVGHQSDQMKVGAVVYREVLEAERARRAVFASGTTPSFLTTPPEYAAFHLEALRLQRCGESEKARVLLEKAVGAAPVLTGQMDGRSFEEFGDSDVFLGPFLELLVNEKYAWLPFEEISRIELAKPKQLRDLVWARAKVEARGGNLGEVFLPVLYPGTAECRDESVKLGRATEWIDAGAGLARGIGQRLFLVDGQERGMLEVAEISFTHAAEAAAPQA